MKKSEFEILDNGNTIVYRKRVYRKVKTNNRFKRSDGVLLNRQVWQDHHGFIPPVTDIMHKDGDHLNNHIDNLYAIPRLERIRIGIDGRKPRNYTPEKRAALSLQARIRWKLAKHKMKSKKCELCGMLFECFYPERRKFCGPGCQQKSKNMNKPQILKSCQCCKKAFIVKSNSTRKFCSMTCAHHENWRLARDIYNSKNGIIEVSEKHIRKSQTN